tara:strand:- start:532 stop:738 length:207 start_codon:yes stop_codon:yes gene_type:complete
LWKAWTLHKPKSQIGGVVPIHGVPRQTNQLPNSLTSIAGTIGEINLINSVFSENLPAELQKHQSKATN